MSPGRQTEKRAWRRRPEGFSLLEMMVTLIILLAVTGIVMLAMMQMTKTQGSVANRTAMHSSVRSATELLQQEIGQAGKIALPTAANGGPTKMTSAITAGLITNTALGYTGAAVLDASGGVYNGMQLVIDTGDQEETVAVTNLVPSTNTFTGTFYLTHAANAPVRVSGAFASGIIPPNPPNTVNPSDGTHLKMYGDINDDKNMVYIEYTCDTTAGTLTRSVAPFTSATVGTNDVLLSNITVNPPDPGTIANAPCFRYQVKSVGTDNYVVDVSVTLTVQSQNLDPQTHQLQKETKALLNVAPRNIFDGWQLAAGGATARIQPMPPTVGPASGTLSTQ